MAALAPPKYTPVAVDPASLFAPYMFRTDAIEGVEIHPLDVRAWALSGPPRPDAAFIALHGRGGEDGTIQGLLDLLGIRYTGSGVLASALAMDKAMTKRVLSANGLPTPWDVLVRHPDLKEPDRLIRTVEDGPGFPVIVKPNREGSTIGCNIVRDPAELKDAVVEALSHDITALIEQYLIGTEITVGLLGNSEPRALPIIEIVARGGFYDYEAKYEPGGSEHIIPARISDLAVERAREYARRTHDLIGCRGMSRVDMIVVGDQPYVLEINTIPGMTPTSLLPDAAKAAGIGFAELLDRIIELAL
jgi:D-alanine-D-alanine ligase